VSTVDAVRTVLLLVVHANGGDVIVRGCADVIVVGRRRRPGVDDVIAAAAGAAAAGGVVVDCDVNQRSLDDVTNSVDAAGNYDVMISGGCR
jgi:hypothetical protein